MQGVEHANPLMLLVMAFVAWVFFSTLKKARQGRTIHIRRIPGVSAIEEAVGRAAELGRPTVFSTGLTDVGPVLYACLGVLHSVSQRIARLRTKIIVPQYTPEAMAIVEDNVRDAYQSVGREQSFDPQCVVFLSGEQFAYAAGYMGLVHREKAASCFLFGSFAAESLILAEAGQQVGAMQVAASVSPEQVAFFVCTCDYTLIGEELFAASAYLTNEPVQLSSIRAQDFVKLSTFVIIAAGVFGATLYQTPYGKEFLDWVGTQWNLIDSGYQSMWNFALGNVDTEGK